MLVEDNDDTRGMLAEALPHLAYEVLPAQSGEAALELLSREVAPLDAIIADIGLPGMDGYELLRRARTLPSVANVPAIALTGFGQEHDVQLAQEAGYVEHLVKPVNIEVLDERIRYVASRRAGSRRST